MIKYRIKKGYFLTWRELYGAGEENVQGFAFLRYIPPQRLFAGCISRAFWARCFLAGNTAHDAAGDILQRREE